MFESRSIVYFVDALIKKRASELPYAEGGASHRVYALVDSDEQRRIKAMFGPYQSR